MFTGIIECLGKVIDVQIDGTNHHITIESKISSELKIDQSVAHDGVCLTVVKCNVQCHVVTAIKETIDKTSLKTWDIGSEINLERCVRAQDRMDGHFVQGHVDQVLTCAEVKKLDGSWNLTFNYPTSISTLLVARGSITINGISLTVAELDNNKFKVAIIPYTYLNTNIKNIKAGDVVNVELDILGKYIQRHLEK